MRISFLFLSLLGCGKGEEEITPIDKASFLADYPRYYCLIQEECLPDRFRDLFDNDFDTCLETASGPVANKIEDEDCDFDGQLAAECVAYVQALDCDSWEANEDDTCSVSTICGE